MWKNQEKVNSGKRSGSYEYQRDVYGHQRRVWVPRPTKVSFSGTTNLKGLREAGKQLCIKGASKLNEQALRTKILDQGLRFGFVDEDEYDDLLEGGSDSDFNKK